MAGVMEGLCCFSPSLLVHSPPNIRPDPPRAQLGGTRVKAAEFGLRRRGGGGTGGIVGTPDYFSYFGRAGATSASMWMPGSPIHPPLPTPRQSTRVILPGPAQQRYGCPSSPRLQPRLGAGSDLLFSYERKTRRTCKGSSLGYRK